MQDTNKTKNYYNEKELTFLNFKSCGKNVFISKNTLIVNPEKISIGDNVRIDSFTSLIASSSINIGSYVHIGCNVYINGAESVVLSNFCGLSAGVKLFTSTDDYSGDYLTNPTVPKKFNNTKKGRVVLEEFVNVGSNSVIMPSVIIKKGSAVGALSMVTKSLPSWYIYMGVPVRKIKKRSKTIEKLAKSIYEK